MIKGDCPVSGRIVDIMTHSNEAVNLVSHHGKWQSKLFENQFQLMEWMSGFDLKKAAPKAKIQKGQHGMKLVGDGWLTQTMTPIEFTQWCSDLGIDNPVDAEVKAQAKKNLAAKKKPAPAKKETPAKKESVSNDDAKAE